jgi:hypothetical protein
MGQAHKRSNNPHQTLGFVMMKYQNHNFDIPKNLIADPPCKVSNGKGSGGTCPLASLCAQSHEMGTLSLAAGL